LKKKRKRKKKKLGESHHLSDMSINALVRGLLEGKVVLLYSTSPEDLLRNVRARFLVKTVSRVESSPKEMKLLLQSKSWTGRQHIVIVDRYAWDAPLLAMIKKKASKVGVLLVHDGEWHTLRPALERTADLTVRLGRGPPSMFTHIDNKDMESAREAGDDALLIRLMQSSASASVDLDHCSDVDLLFTNVPSEVAMSLLPLLSTGPATSKKTDRDGKLLRSKRDPKKMYADQKTNEQLLDQVIWWYSTKKAQMLISRREVLERLVHDFDVADSLSLPFICSDDSRLNNQIIRFAGRLRTMSGQR
jgi:hypothetical protein